MKPFVTLFSALLVAAAPHAHGHAATKNHQTKAHGTPAATAKAKGTPKPAAKKPAIKPVSTAAIDYAGEQVNFGEWQAVREFEDDMVARHGFARSELDAIIRQVRFVESAVQLIKPAPPGKPKNWRAYSERFIEPIRINAGVRFWNENAEALARAEQTYGVPAEIIVGVIGVETLYGRDTGRFRVMDTLTTLAFAYPETPNRADRMAFFRSELENTLLFARTSGVDPFSLLGSFAGAVGMPQFMPGNIVKYGVDFDGDGRVDLRNSAADAIGSVANFLVQHGWSRDVQGPPVYAAEVSPGRAWEPMLGGGLSANFRADQLAAAGVITRAALPALGQYGLVDLQNGADPTEYWVANNNFFAITKYNRSYFYAMSVIELGRAVRLSRAM
ncbi:lytic murein transglycosylase B [Massilia horti]|uniref:Lytic murein transglycosylase B n=1 Tax=Massilia horti TaxID=2562153 RepID=A0A4Y9T3T0_9BURK|nr:lytic murein transglycosylase B [Massilia horti]TFW34473.1 lytic murein transglycosylase B [Massilia horti]